MKVLYGVFMLAMLIAPLGAMAQKAGQSSQVSVGIVENARPVQLTNNKTGKGAVVGTTVGALRDSNNRTRSVVTGALVGGAVGKVASTSAPGMEYSVRTGPNSVMKVISNQTEIHIGDCVSVQQSGNMANVARIDSAKCAQAKAPQEQAQPVASSSSSGCEGAKQEFANASTQEALDLAKQKMDALCN